MSPKEQHAILAEEVIRELSPVLTREVRGAVERAHNKAGFRTAVTHIIERLAEEIDLSLSLREEYTPLDSGRADAVYDCFVIEHEAPATLRPYNTYRTNEHAVGQVQRQVEGLHKVEVFAG